MLHQIGKNVDGHYFKLFINELANSFSNDDEMSPISFGGKNTYRSPPNNKLSAPSNLVYPETPPNYRGNGDDEEISNVEVKPAKDENWEYDY